jgi:hypothetical protein
MYSASKDLVGRSVRVRTLVESLPRDSAVPAFVFDIADGCLVLELTAGELIVIPWHSVVSIEIDYRAARNSGWDDIPEEAGSLSEIRRTLFEAERGRCVGLPEEKVDELALRAHASLRRMRLEFSSQQIH